MTIFNPAVRSNLCICRPETAKVPNGRRSQGSMSHREPISAAGGYHGFLRMQVKDFVKHIFRRTPVEWSLNGKHVRLATQPLGEILCLCLFIIRLIRTSHIEKQLLNAFLMCCISIVYIIIYKFGLSVCLSVCLYVTIVTFHYKTKTTEWIKLIFSQILHWVPRSYPVKF